MEQLLQMIQKNGDFGMFVEAFAPYIFVLFGLKDTEIKEKES